MIEAASFPVFYQIAALLVLAAGIGLLGVLLRQPLVVSYIVVGLVAGPSVLGIAHGDEHIDLLAELGVAVLLFLVGLKLDTNLIRSLGRVALAAGLGQIVFTAAFGFAICLGLGLDWVTAAYVTVAITFSSTIIIVKLLSDKGEIGSLHGRIALGILIVQDIAVVAAMVGLSAYGAGVSATDSVADPVVLTLETIAVLVGIVLFIRYAATPIVVRLACSPELLVSFAIGWAAMLAALGDYLGFGKELGGLFAGVSLASTPFREAMSTRLTSLRDFLLLFFFIALGARLDLGSMGGDITTALVLSLFVLIGKPLIVMAVVGAAGYRKRTSFLAAVSLGQISEFSLIFIAMALALGHVDKSAVGLVTLVGLITIGLSAYMITYAQTLCGWITPMLAVFERRRPFREMEEEGASGGSHYDAIVFGLGRYGGVIAHHLQQSGLRVLGVDFSPVAVRARGSEGIDVAFGDATDPDFVEHLPLAGVRWVISAVPDHDIGVSAEDPRMTLIQTLRARGYRGRIAIATTTPAAAARIDQAGVDLVLQPYQDAADRAAELILSGEARPPAPEIDEPEEQRELNS